LASPPSAHLSPASSGRSPRLHGIHLAEFSLKFGPSEVFCLVLLGMFTIIYVGGKEITKSLMSNGSIGSGLGCVGTDIVEGQNRFTYGIAELLDALTSSSSSWAPSARRGPRVGRGVSMKIEPMK